jgi:hypothetical protein
MCKRGTPNVGVTQPRSVRAPDRALTLREAKELCGVPEHRLRQCRSERTLDSFKLEHAVLVSERNLVKFLEAHREPAARPAESKVPDHSGVIAEVWEGCS